MKYYPLAAENQVFCSIFSRNILTNIYMTVILTIDSDPSEVISLETDEKKTAVVFKAFCDENRIRILKLLKDGEKCACRLLEEMQITQPTLSHHMKILCDSGVVVGRKEGKWTHYSISTTGAAYAVQCLKELTTIETLHEEKPCCEE